MRRRRPRGKAERQNISAQHKSLGRHVSSGKRDPNEATSFEQVASENCARTYMMISSRSNNGFMTEEFGSIGIDVRWNWCQ